MKTSSAEHPALCSFAREAGEILKLPVLHRVSANGGYGPAGEVIYEQHPDGCPSTLVTTCGPAKATFMSNGSIAFEVKHDNGMEVVVLSPSFDATEKREINVCSNNLWLSLARNRQTRTAALLNPRSSGDCRPRTLKVVKLGDPTRAMWFCAEFAPFPARAFQTALRFRLALTPAGPALLRQLFVRNTGRKPLQGALWSFFNLHGTQRFVYNKEIWYDSGLPLTPTEIVVSASVPYSDVLQIKRLSSVPGPGLAALDATCDYTSFVGDSACSTLAPAAVREGKLRDGAGRGLNRFSIATITANQFALTLAPGESTTLLQSLAYITDPRLVEQFRQKTSCRHPDYPRVLKAFLNGARQIVKETPDAAQTAALAAAEVGASRPPAFVFNAPRQPVISEYAKSLWTVVAELYENCRAHGARLAQGIELGTRDRSQDMWPMMKEDPGRVRADLIHAFSFMYMTVAAGARWSKPLTRVQKLHGMYPRQFPSRWDERDKEVKNDNRPYADSAVWLVDSLNMYVRETGDVSILGERVRSVRLTTPETPETSGLVGCERSQTVAEAVLGIFACYRRHVEDSPYGLAQVMYGDWCDPVDMFGTSVAGDPATRGMGRGAQVRLSAHVFSALVNTIELLSSAKVRAALGRDVSAAAEQLKRLADTIRRNALRFAWEDAPNAGFISAIHELRADGSRPDYAKGEKGYTLGSASGSDYDGAARRDLTALAYGLRMLQIERDYLAPVPKVTEKIRGLLATCDKFMFSDKLGLRLLTPPIACDENARRLVGRMGVVPAGCAENGEYHHGQMMMHRFRLLLPGQADQAWRQFKPMVSATRDESLAGPFEMPATSYASDPADPHFGKGMYFGLSGSTAWIIEFLQSIAGLELNLHDDAMPAIRFTPRLPKELGETLTLKRTVWAARPGGHYKPISLTLEIRGSAAGTPLGAFVTVNGSPVDKAEIRCLDGFDRLEVVITASRVRY